MNEDLTEPIDQEGLIADLADVVKRHSLDTVLEMPEHIVAVFLMSVIRELDYAQSMKKDWEDAEDE